MGIERGTRQLRIHYLRHWKDTRLGTSSGRVADVGLILSQPHLPHYMLLSGDRNNGVIGLRNRFITSRLRPSTLVLLEDKDTMDATHLRLFCPVDTQQYTTAKIGHHLVAICPPQGDSSKYLVVEHSHGHIDAAFAREANRVSWHAPWKVHIRRGRRSYNGRAGSWHILDLSTPVLISHPRRIGGNVPEQGHCKPARYSLPGRGSTSRGTGIVRIETLTVVRATTKRSPGEQRGHEASVCNASFACGGMAGARGSAVNSSLPIADTEALGS